VSRRCYIDTSALAKWYVPEAGSEEFEEFVNSSAAPERVVSGLCPVELRCLLARRRRAGDFDADYERDACASFSRHVVGGLFVVRPLSDLCLPRAIELIERLAPLPLRTLDALHLAAAAEAGAGLVATADGVMADAAEALGLDLAFFGPRRT
jgi:uncharacterized protein